MNIIEYTYRCFIEERFPLPGEEEVVALEWRLGVELPDDYRQYVLNFNGGFFCEPEIATDNEDTWGDALTCMHGINSGQEISELANPRRLAIFEEFDPSFFIPIGHTSLGGFIVIVTDEEQRGMIFLKKAFGDFHYLADGIEELFGLLRERAKG